MYHDHPIEPRFALQGKTGTDVKDTYKGSEIRTFLEGKPEKVIVFKKILNFNKLPHDEPDYAEVNISKDTTPQQVSAIVPSKKRKVEDALMEFDS